MMFARRSFIRCRGCHDSMVEQYNRVQSKV
jgi:hypothetical protein